MLEGQKRVLEMITECNPLSDILHALLVSIEEKHPEALCSILLIDKEGHNLWNAVAPNLPDSFTQVLHGVSIQPSTCTFGHAIYHRKTVITSDIASDFLWSEYRELALQHGLRSCWSVPIFSSNDHVLGAFAVYFRTPREPLPHERKSIEEAAYFAKLAIENKNTQERLRESMLRYQNLVETIDAIVWEADPQTFRFTFVSPQAEKLLGYPIERWLDDPNFWATHLHHDDRERVITYCKEAAAESRDHTVEYRMIAANGNTVWLRDTVTVVKQDGRTQLHRGIMFDITAHKKAEERLHFLAHFDSLTNLPNRNHFMVKLRSAMEKAKQTGHFVAVMFLDLDRFKLVNDTLGHAMGDRLLEGVTTRLFNCLGEYATISRIGGDEFVILLPIITQEEEAIYTAQKVIDTMQKPWILKGHDFYITASIGVSMFPQDGEDSDTLLKNADIAMYRAKERGRNHFQFYTSSMNTANIERLTLESSLRRALERDEFTLHYQPQMDLRTGRIIGMEALIRWQSPELGNVPPSKFIPLTEEIGVIKPLGEWILRTACAQNKAWQDAGLPPMRVSVNLSAIQFQQQDLAETIANILRETKLGPEWLGIEITESVAIQDVEFTTKILRDIRQMGIKTSLDDFGTGFSSLSYLKNFNIDTLKIDSSFVNDIGTEQEDSVIVSSIILLAHNMNLGVIAEGVETEEQLAFLKEKNCDAMQGYLFSKPKPVHEFEDMLRSMKS